MKVTYKTVKARAHVSQSRPDSSLGLQGKVLKNPDYGLGFQEKSF